ncbi:cobaltochelatase subunit CobN [Alteromonas sp. C1M14]|uniref:cobaltochelatase subunit CobN n=1 Tax=Alteromonas sp. C1M14 TaxID=2841567 RepID=UPI001C089597|nr:cobaltochelatase subunit CobN [Alteromonas sp. C1M14]MBU2979821.1 cobaltochelatase subunit CobN [Alteromonas sp. C1M14]
MRFASLIFILFVSNAFAQSHEYLLVLTSERNAETVAQAGLQFQVAQPNLHVRARTDRQISEMSDSELAALIEQSHGVIGIGLFGATVPRLTPILRNFAKPVFVLSSDHRLIALSRGPQQPFFSDVSEVNEVSGYRFGKNMAEAFAKLKKNQPKTFLWLYANAYWQAGESDNAANLFAWFFHLIGEDIPVPLPHPIAKVRWFYNDKLYNRFPVDMDEASATPHVFIIDHAGGGRPADLAILRYTCEQIRAKVNAKCIGALAYWGESGVDAVSTIVAKKLPLLATVMFQDFVIGAGEGREQVTQLLRTLNVPVIKAIKLRDRSHTARLLSADGLSHEKVYYQVAMPELQGASQPLVIATAGKPKEDDTTGIRTTGIVAEQEGVRALVTRLEKWQKLQNVPNKDKKVAIVYYNHPPGRHNIGADNLDVPASLWHLLRSLKAAGYNTGPLPVSPEALLTELQEKGVNLPNDKGALATMRQHTAHVSLDDYQAWFNTLPESITQEMRFGPFGRLDDQIKKALADNKPQWARTTLGHTREEMVHLLEGVDHPARERALALLKQLNTAYENAIAGNNAQGALDDAQEIITALTRTGIEGLSGWGEPPGKVMTYQGQFLLPGIQYNNIFIGPQPPRGWEINEELLHANLAFPPPHQYLAFYHYLQDTFAADALIHLGRHSTYEFLPTRSVGVAFDDYPRIIGGDIPGIYPYIVDGVGEGIQAKRRGLAVMIDHLTPPLAATPLYDDLLQLRQMVESYEASHASGNDIVATRLVTNLRATLDKLELKDELAEAMSAELSVMGIGFEDVDDDMLVHEVGHYLTNLQERFMPLGLHIFGKDWNEQAITMMVSSMLQENKTLATTRILEQGDEGKMREALIASPKAEMAALLSALNGQFVSPGPGNDPIRSPQSLPTGRNFYALSSELIPSKVAWEVGSEMAQGARQNNKQSKDKKEAVILWASDVVRDEGVMIAFGLDMLGLKPVWNSRGLVKGLTYMDTADSAGDDVSSRIRRDTLFTTSGLFRDLYGHQIALLNEAWLMALAASKHTIIEQYPALTLSLEAALSPLSNKIGGGNESLTVNQVAAHWVEDTQKLLAENVLAKEAGVVASYRVFGDAPGTYGAGINRLAERSGAWEHRHELAAVFLRRLGHSYTNDGFGIPAQSAYRRAVGSVENTYLGRASNLYGLIDNNDAFDYLGGLSLAVESVSGKAPDNYVMDHANPNRISARPLALALREELRGRYLNPAWLKGMMEHGYAGARTMGSEFVEYLWGWQITNPTLVGDWAWEEVTDVYINDRYGLGLDAFLEQSHNVHVKSNMLAVMLVAIQKGFWHADDEQTHQLASQFVRLVSAHGLPGSGHTDPNHPMLDWLDQYLNAEEEATLTEVLNKAKGTAQEAPSTSSPTRITEVSVAEKDQDNGKQRELTQGQDSKADDHAWSVNLFIALAALGFILIAGMLRGLILSNRITGSADKK